MRNIGYKLGCPLVAIRKTQMEIFSHHDDHCPLFLLAVIFITLYYTTKQTTFSGAWHPAFRHAGKLSGQYTGTGRPAALCGPASSLPPPQAGTSSDGSRYKAGHHNSKETSPDIESQEAETLISLAESKGGESGTLKDLHLRFLRGKTKPDQTVRYVFADIYEEQNSLYWQVIHSSIIGACSFAVFFLFSILLSGWAVKPVEIAWQRQRQFVADASHELKTPFTVILSNADMLEKDRDIPKGQNRQRISHIKAESLRMKQLIESLLALARSDSGQEFLGHTS